MAEKYKTLSDQYSTKESFTVLGVFISSGPQSRRC